MTRKRFLHSVLAAAPFAAALRLSAAGPAIEVFKTPSCGCCAPVVHHPEPLSGIEGPSDGIGLRHHVPRCSCRDRGKMRRRRRGPPGNRTARSGRTRRCRCGRLTTVTPAAVIVLRID